MSLKKSLKPASTIATKSPVYTKERMVIEKLPCTALYLTIDIILPIIYDLTYRYSVTVQVPFLESVSLLLTSFQLVGR